MELFTVTLPSTLHESTEKLRMMLARQTDADLHKAAAGTAALVEYAAAGRFQISCRADAATFRPETHGPAVFKAASGALAEFVLNELETDILTSIIRRKYRNQPTMDVDAIGRYCNELLHGKEWDGLGSKFHEADRARRKAKIESELIHCLRDGAELNIEGLIAFRLAAYRKELAEIVEYALDEYVLDKQYQEFISLLKYFVQMQATKVPNVHLLHKGGHEFMLYNESFQALEPKPPAERIVAEMLETEMNIEDMVISSLISISPGHITIHTRQPELGVIRTIETIFEGRVKICLQCASCSSTLDELIQP